jgi:peptidyl-tRNA hydrolase, PTH1 family
MTRHNIGFLVADELSRRWGVDMRSQNRFEGVYGSGRYQEKSVGLLKPTTFMNLSGQSGRKVRTKSYCVYVKRITGV